jgi:hypothetical protein
MLSGNQEIRHGGKMFTTSNSGEEKWFVINFKVISLLIIHVTFVSKIIHMF